MLGGVVRVTEGQNTRQFQYLEFGAVLANSGDVHKLELFQSEVHKFVAQVFQNWDNIFMEVNCVLSKVGVSKLQFCQALELHDIVQNLLCQVAFHYTEIATNF